MKDVSITETSRFSTQKMLRKEMRKKVNKKAVLLSSCAVVLVAVVLIGLVIPAVNANKEIQVLRNAETGDYVFFGAYEQETTIRGKEPVEWLVLAKDEEKMILISRYVLDYQSPYEERHQNATWGGSSVRDWLNKDFYRTAFSVGERNFIKKTSISTEWNPDTEDKVYLLSRTEAQTYFASEVERNCESTQYAQSQGSKIRKDLVTGKSGTSWLLRTTKEAASERRPDELFYVTPGGRIYGSGDMKDKCGIRPVICVEID